MAAIGGCPLVNPVGLIFGFELASVHLKTSQKLDVGVVAADDGFAGARFLLRFAKLRPALGQLVFGVCFVFRAGIDRRDGTHHFFATVSGDPEGDIVLSPAPLGAPLGRRDA